VRNFPDHPLVRRSAGCPICDGPKQSGCVWCWECHNTTQLAEDHSVREDAEDQLDLVEAQLQDIEDARMRIFL